MKTYSAIDLLENILEFIEMTPNSSEWNLGSLKANSPRQIRFRQIESLFNAFFMAELNPHPLGKIRSLFSKEQKLTIQSFLKGDFITGRAVIEYSLLDQQIKDFVKRHNSFNDNDRLIATYELMFLYRKLINFKQKLRGVLLFNSGWLEAGSMTSQFSIYLTGSIANNLHDKYSELDDFIAGLIDPQHMIFTKDELIKKFNFPAENLNDVDIDFT